MVPSVDPGAVRSRCHRRRPVALAVRLEGVETTFGQTKVNDLSVSTPGDKNVCRFDVAMNDAFCVGRVERIGNLHGQ